MTAVLRITNGTETVDLLNEFALVDWEPTIQDWKDGGLYADSPLADLRQPVDVHLNTALETFEVTLTAANQDAIAETWQRLRRLLNEAVRYWIDDWRTTPVWLEAQSACETSPRYAVIYNWRTPADANPYAPPFTNNPPIAANRQLVLERGPWLETPPGEGVCVPGELEPAEGEECELTKTYITNHVAPMGKVDRVVFYDQSAGTYTNMPSSGVEDNLFPVPVGVGDALYFGRRRDPLTSMYIPFSSVLIHTVKAGSGYTGVWQIYTSSGWVNLGVYDETNGLTGVGWVECNFGPPPNWTYYAVNSISGLWVRFVITNVVSPFNSPVYLEITSTTNNAVGIPAQSGDLPALLRCQLRHLVGTVNVIYMGTRSKWRGADFVSCLNFCDIGGQNPFFVNVAAFGGASFATAYDAPAGRVVVFTPGGASPESVRASIALTDQIGQYQGVYRLFLRCRDTSTPPGKFIVRVGVFLDSTQIYNSKRVTTNTAINDPQLLDLGAPTIAPRATGLESCQLVFNVYIESLSGASNLQLFDLILIPADEWFGELRIIPYTIAPDYTSYTDLDGIKPRTNNLAVERLVSNSRVYAPYLTITTSPPQLPVNQEAALYIITMGYNNWKSHWYNDHSVNLTRQARYYSLRGGA